MVQDLYRFHKKVILSIKIFLLCGFFRAAILFLPFNKLKYFMGDSKEESPLEISYQEKEEVLKISRYVKKISSVTLWESKCLVQALTAKYILKRHKINSTLYLGVSKDNNKNIKAHSWLRCGNLIVTGEEFKDKYKEISKFSDSIR